MLLTSYKPTSPGMRSKVNLKFLNTKQPSHPNLYCGFTHSAGRNNSGKRTVFSKGTWHGKRVFRKLIESLNKLHTLSMVTAVTPRVDVRTAASLIRTAAGAWYYAPTTNNTSLFSYIRTTPLNATLATSMQAGLNWFWCIKTLPPHTRISCVPVFQNKIGVLAKSAGTSCLLLAGSLWENWALIKMPSGAVRLISNNNWVMPGVTAPTTRRMCLMKKSTKYLQYGFRPQVRGVAKNPNDHPHGGRTKSIKYARTPWGKTAKKSRKPSLLIEWKPLLKRKLSAKVYTDHAQSNAPQNNNTQNNNTESL